jgi:hypothetical protein
MRLLTHPAPFLAAALALCVARPAAAEDLTYDGATTIGTKVMQDAAPAFEKKTGNKFTTIGTAGTGEGLKAALAGEVSVAGVSRSLTGALAGLAVFPHGLGFGPSGVFLAADRLLADKDIAGRPDEEAYRRAVREDLRELGDPVQIVEGSWTLTDVTYPWTVRY